MDRELRIGPWRVQPGRGRLLGPGGPAAVSGEAVALLALLASRPGRAVTRREALEAVWGDPEAPESRVVSCVRGLRRALGDDPKRPTFIETVPRRGYRLIAPVSGAVKERPAPGRGAPAAVGDEVDSRYRLLERIGDGGMGVIFRASDTRLGRTVALKFLPEGWSEDPLAKERFLHEARAAAALDHPNICTLHEVAETADGQMFFVMAHYRGETLKSRLDRGPMPWREAVQIARKVAAGLACAHRRGIVHRDVKPSNIMLTEEGEVKILDFGVARHQGDVRLTRTGTAVGTPTHMAPEQIRGREVDHRADIWSLGVVLYEMLAGRLPFAAHRDHAVLYAIVHEEAEPLHTLAEIPLEIERVVERALAKEAEERYASAEEMLADLETIEDGTLSGSRTFHFDTGRPTASIAVLPLADLSPAGDQEYFCDGVAEELIHALARIEGLRVVSRTSAFKFKGESDLRSIGRKLRVGSVLTGSVRTAGRKLRITVELVDLPDGRTLWTERFDREMADVFAVQDEIARSVAETLSVRLASAVPATPLVRPHTADLEAYTLFLKGRHLWNKRTEEGLQQSVACFRSALDRDPTYARAYCGLADAYATIGIYGALPPERVMPAARAAASRALGLDATLAEAYASLGCVQSVYEWRWEEAETSFRRALSLDSNYATAHQWHAMNALVPRGRFDEAVLQLERARQLDPLSLAIHASLGVAAYFSRRYATAAATLRATLELDPGFAFAHFFLGQTLSEMFDPEGAVSACSKAVDLTGGSAETLAALGVALARAERGDEAIQVLAELESKGRERYVSPSLLAMIHAALGASERALDRLEEAVAQRSSDLAWVRVRPVFDPLRSDPRYQSIIERMGLAGGTTGATVREVPLPPGEAG